MVAYEFYCRDENTGYYQSIGLVPERRRDQKRVSPVSILNLGKTLVGNDSLDGFYFVKVTIDENGEVSYPKPLF